MKEFVKSQFKNKSERKEILAMPTKEFCYLIGCSFGDAYIFAKKYAYGKYIFGLTAKDKDFLLKFKGCLEKEFKIKAELHTRRNKRFNIDYFEIRIQRKEIVLELADKRNIEFIKSLPSNLKIEVLRGMFDSDGNVRFDKRNRLKDRKYPYEEKSLVVRFSNKRYPDVFEYLLKELQIPYRKSEYPNTIEFRMRGKNGIIFHNLFGKFTIERKEKIFQEFLNTERKLYINWTEKEKNIFRKQHGKVSDKELSEILDRSVSAIRHKVGKYG